ncbi:hypothetical protein CF326_g3256 [Tilletia indica]|uniref:Uncharacterized protein n=1 Tax=Tilletia indica TaxID=43049 RepID=A0A177TBH2_9BASI|nr:hypothetical protein CF326_g3256 [Tilletia indica]KAE8238450.1 hypothetical protein A4X13_0g8504 [Tilletia indica]
MRRTLHNSPAQPLRRPSRPSSPTQTASELSPNSQGATRKKRATAKPRNKLKKSVEEQPQETDELDRLRKQAGHVSLTPRPPKLKSRPASIFLPSGGLAAAMAHCIDPLPTQRGVVPSSSSIRKMHFALKRNSILLSDCMGALSLRREYYPASSVDSSLFSSISKVAKGPLRRRALPLLRRQLPPSVPLEPSTNPSGMKTMSSCPAWS